MTFTLTGTPTQERSTAGAFTVTLLPAVQWNVAVPNCPVMSSVAVTVAFPLYAAVIVPEMRPETGSIDSPGGRPAAENTKSGIGSLSLTVICRLTGVTAGR